MQRIVLKVPNIFMTSYDKRKKRKGKKRKKREKERKKERKKEKDVGREG